LKILIATESYYPNISGVAVFSHNLAKRMQENGHKVFVIAPLSNFREHQEVVDGVKIFRLESKKNKFRDGYFVSKFPFKKVAKIIEKIKPDVIHLQDPVMISLGALFKARKMKIPVVVTNHFSLEYIISYVPALKFINPVFLAIATRYLNWFYGKCNILTCPTKTVADRFLQSGVKTKVKVVSNGVDLSRFMPHFGDTNIIKRKFGIPISKPIILYVGRVDIDKNLITLIKSIPFVVKKLDAHFVIVGQGRERKKLKEIIREDNLKKNITFVDFIPYGDDLLPKIYQASDIFINPCPTETQSIVVLEAQATGLPVIVANAGALPEIIKNGQNGFLFNTGDEKELARKVIDILSDKKLAKKMGECGIEIINKHIADKTYSQFEKIYRTVSAS